MSTARKTLRWAPGALLIALGCASTDEIEARITLNDQRYHDLNKRFEPIPMRLESLNGRLLDLHQKLTDLETRLGQLQMDLAQLAQHSPALARFESAQQRQARLAELLGKFSTADDAEWLDVKEGLIRIGAPAVSPLLQRILAGEAIALRRVPEVLRNLVDSEAVQPLAAGLEQPTTRALCAEALGLLGNPEGVAWLRIHLSDESADVKHAVAVALGRLKDLSGIPVLIEELAAKELDIRLIAIRELEQLTGQDFGYSAYGEDAEARSAAIARARAWHAAKTAPPTPPPDKPTEGADR